MSDNTWGALSIPFNKPSLVGNELTYIKEALSRGKLSGNGYYTQQCSAWFERYLGGKAFLTTSCTDALEMSAILLNIKEGDEVILPSYTFVSTANAFMLRGASLVFADSGEQNPCIDCSAVEKLITSKTKAIVIVHYAGISCDMDALEKIHSKYGIPIVEDAAQAIGSTFNGRLLGTFGDCATFSFHETKNIHCGEGGMLIVNNPALAPRAEVIWEKGTNRAAFFRGEARKYEWIDIGSSFLPSELNAAYLLAQLECFESIQAKRRALFTRYQTLLEPLVQEGFVRIPNIPAHVASNGHIFYLECQNSTIRTGLIEYLGKRGILAVSHYLSLHTSPYYHEKHDGRQLFHSDRYTNCLLRLPMYYELSFAQVDGIVELVNAFFR